MDDRERLIQILKNQILIMEALYWLLTPHEGLESLVNAMVKNQKKSENLLPLYAEGELPED